MSAAEKLQGEKSQRHISFHLAGLALEEIGKIEMLGMQYVIQPRIEEERRINLDVEAHTHERKLFWALWGPSFGRELLTKKQIQSFQGLAKNIHQTRLDSLYVNPNNPTPPGKAMSAKQLDNLVKLARARLGMEQNAGGMKLDEDQFTEDEKNALDWFLQATNDPLERQFIFRGESNLKLVQLGGVKPWVAWLYEEAIQRQKDAQQVLATEMSRKEPGKKERFEPKWSMKIKISSHSHSIRKAVFEKWNKQSEQLKLHDTKDKHEFVIELILPKVVPLAGLWQTGWTMSRMFVTSLNIASTGLIWWNIPRDTSRYYDAIKDLEHPGMGVKAELGKVLELDWKSHKLVLNDQVLTDASAVYVYLMGLMDNQAVGAALQRYTTGLALFAKSDLHLRLELYAWGEFFGALKLAVAAFGDQKNGEDITDALRHIIPKEVHTSLEKCLEIDRTIATSNGQPPKIEITLTEVMSAKGLFDYYFKRKTKDWVRQKQSAASRPA